MANKEKEFALYWLAAADSGRVSKSDWQTWAKNRLAIADQTEDWAFALGAAESIDELWKVLGPHLLEGEVQETLDNAVLGHIWQRYVDGDISLRECLHSAAEKADSGSATIECEEIYALLKELSESGDEATVSQKAAQLFSDVHEIAQKQWFALFDSNGKHTD